jgi:hypothetical protein
VANCLIEELELKHGRAALVVADATTNIVSETVSSQKEIE